MMNKKILLTMMLGMGMLAGAAQASDGEALFMGTCMACHGTDGTGMIPGTPDFTDPSGPLSKTDEVLMSHIMNGFQSPGSPMAMPPKGGNPSLNEDDVKAILAYMRKAFGK